MHNMSILHCGIRNRGPESGASVDLKPSFTCFSFFFTSSFFCISFAETPPRYVLLWLLLCDSTLLYNRVQSTHYRFSMKYTRATPKSILIASHFSRQTPQPQHTHAPLTPTLQFIHLYKSCAVPMYAGRAAGSLPLLLFYFTSIHGTPHDESPSPRKIKSDYF